MKWSDPVKWIKASVSSNEINLQGSEMNTRGFRSVRAVLVARREQKISRM